MMGIKQELHRWTISYYDFEKAKGFLNELGLLKVNSLAFEAVCSMSIISYAKPFSPNEKKPVDATSYLKVEDFEFLDADLLLHKELVLIRNKALAHSEFSYNPTTVFENGVMMSRQFSLQSTGIFDRRKIVGFASLIEKAISTSHGKRASLVTSVRLSGA